jgi:UDP-N-acetylmuramoyl-L-alanyl-D-glutamate--2,6-diaminopimelate ligase
MNLDDEWYERLGANSRCSRITVSTKTAAGLQAKNVRLLSDGICYTALTEGKELEVSVPIPGRFTVCNTLTVLGIVKALGVDLQQAVKVLSKVEGVKGRIEVVPTPGKPYTVLIDYAHTPDGLDNVLRSVRDFCKGRLIAVFGCGGDRDPIKRPIMGRIGVELSDLAIITSDNPRTEDPDAIIRDIVAGVEPAMGAYEVIADRRKAIEHAMDIGRKNDIIVLAGKGHETYQEICGVKHHLDEREEVARCLQKRG